MSETIVVALIGAAATVAAAIIAHRRGVASNRVEDNRITKTPVNDGLNFQERCTYKVTNSPDWLSSSIYAPCVVTCDASGLVCEFRDKVVLHLSNRDITLSKLCDSISNSHGDRGPCTEFCVELVFKFNKHSFVFVAHNDDKNVLSSCKRSRDVLASLLKKLGAKRVSKLINS